MEEKQEFKKTLGFFPVLAMVMGTVIGSGVFFKAGTIAGLTGNAGLHLLVWLLGGILSLAGGLTAAELAAAIPETGGLIRYIERGFGKAWGFVTGWAQMLINYPAQIAALATVFAAQFLNLFGLKDSNGVLTIVVGLIAALSVTLLNFISAKVAGGIQSVTLVIKLIPIVLIIIVGLLVNPHPVSFSLFPVAVGSAVANHPSLAQTIGLGLLATMFAYDGWIYVGNVAGEMKNPKKDLPRAIIFGLIAITLIYVFINAAYIRTLGVDGSNGLLANAGNTSILPGMVANKLFGGGAGTLITIGIMISVYGTINGYTMAGSRATFAFAEDNKIGWLNKLSKNGVPVNAGILQIIIAVLMLLTTLIPASGEFAAAGGAFGLLTNLCIFANWLFYTMVFIAVFVLRKKEPDMVRPYKVPLYPVIPIIATLGGVFILVMTLTGSFLGYQLPAIIGLIVVIVGFPVYSLVNKKNK
ncbi:APC family permease [Lactococcus termiticola]|uniref:Amino acid permease n=1 Tax=Lactococcus termiticola TaxID=2169526 RepID=A0A2R5HF99_9LACT|nr:amino acid permease [Lactococcus termiticola]GBG96743.1 amino acid permease [Lactococcus termiticola]